jgi:hypothetical protein
MWPRCYTKILRTPPEGDGATPKRKERPNLLDQLSSGENKFFESGGDDDGLKAEGGAATETSGASTETGGANDTVSVGGGADTTTGGDTVAGGAATDSIVGAADVTNKTVPLAALLEERTGRKDLQKKYDILEQRTNDILKAIAEGRIGSPANADGVKPGAAAAEVPEFKIPALEEDAGGHVLGRLALLEHVLQTLGNTEVQRQQGHTQQTQKQEVFNNITYHENMARANQEEYPGYDEAMGHLMKARDAELSLMPGFETPQARRTFMAQEAFLIGQRAVATGKNPAAVYYSLAKHRGWTPTAAGAAAAVAGGAAAVAAEVKLPVRVAAALAGREANGTTLSGRRGGGTPPALTAKSLTEMSEADFARAIATKEGMELLGMGG